MGFGSSVAQLANGVVAAHVRRKTPVSPPVDPKGHSYYAGRRVCVELQGCVHKGCTTYVGDDYKAQLGKHHFESVGLPASTRSHVADMVIKATEVTLSKLGIYLAGCKYTSIPSGAEIPVVDFVLEHEYEPKKHESAKREASMLKEFEVHPAKGTRVADCCIWTVGAKLKERGLCITLPPAEFDATCQARLVRGWTVVVVSGDSDIPLYPTGCHIGEIHMVRRLGITIHTAKSKAMAMSDIFRGDTDTGADPLLDQMEAGILPPEFVFLQVEALFLACMTATTHDYHTRPSVSQKDPSKVSYTGATGLALTAWRKLCVAAWRKFHSQIRPEPATVPKSTAVKVALNAACDIVIHVYETQKCEMKWVSHQGYDLKTQIRYVFDGFMQQPVASTPGGGPPAKYIDFLADEKFGSSTAAGGGGACVDLPTLAADDMGKYVYRGKCGGCKKVLEVEWRIPIDEVDPLLKPVRPTNILHGPAAKLPKMLLGDLVRNIGFTGTYEKWRIEGTFHPLDYVLSLLDRISTSASLDWKQALLPDKLHPEGFKMSLGGKAVRLSIVQGRCYQSYGVAGKEKESRMEGAKYVAYAAFEVDQSSGRVVRHPDGQSQAKDGIYSAFCPECKNPLRCEHIHSILAAMCRIDETDMASSTDPYGYWKVKGGMKPDYITSQEKPKGIGELATWKVWLSDITGGPVPDDVVKGLM